MIVICFTFGKQTPIANRAHLHFDRTRTIYQAAFTTTEPTLGSRKHSTTTQRYMQPSTMESAATSSRRSFAIIFVLGVFPSFTYIYTIPPVGSILTDAGAPGAGKGTLSAHLAKIHHLTHYSVGDSLRVWMRNNSGTPLAVQIQTKLDNQGFLSSEDLNRFICRAFKDALNREPELRGILVDGYPRCMEQLESFDPWPFQNELPLAASSDSAMTNLKPDVVLSFRVTKENAKARYVARARDSNDSTYKFERRFAEYELETWPVEEVYRQAGKLIDVRIKHFGRTA